MQIFYQNLDEDNEHVAWVKCNPSDLPTIKEIFPVKSYEILVAIKPNYNPITCDVQTLYNPPSPTWGVDIRKRTDGRPKGLSPRENT